MKLPHFSIHRPVTTSMIFIAIIILGLASLSMLGLDLVPNMEVPAVSVVTAYEGAGPQEVERLITERIEDVLSTISGVDKVLSVSKEGLSAVTLKFRWGHELSEAVNDIREKLDLIKDALPDEAGSPIVLKFDLHQFPIMVFAVSATDSLPNLRYITREKITNPLKRIKGVASAKISGGSIRQIKVELDHDRLVALDVSVTQIKAALAAQNMSTPGGRISSGHQEFLLRTPEEFTDLAEVEEVVVAQRNGILIKLNDVAQITDGYAEHRFDTELNDDKVIVVGIHKQSGSNTVEVASAVKDELIRIRKTLPLDAKVNVFIDNSEFIIASINNLRDTLFWAIFLAFIVLLFFLRDIRASLIVAVAIPVSLIITFLLMKLAGYTVNMISMASLCVAVGLVVDNAIVVVENIKRHQTLGQPHMKSAIVGTEEVGMAVMASTLTTVSIFVPIIFAGGLTAIMFSQFAVIITLALVASLFTALMLVPMMCSRLLVSPETSCNFVILDKFFHASTVIQTAIEKRYKRFLQWSLVNRKTVCLSCLLFLIGMIGIIKHIGTDFFPRQDQGLFSADFELPVGTRYERTGRVAHQLSKIIDKHVPEKRDMYIRWGTLDAAESGEASIHSFSHIGLFIVTLIPQSERNTSPSDIIKRLRKQTNQMPGVHLRYRPDDPLNMILAEGGNVVIELIGHDLDVAHEYAHAVAQAVARVKGVHDVQISLQESKPEVSIVVDREKASRFGLSMAAVGKTIEAYFAGHTVTRYREQGDEFDVRLRLRAQDRETLEDLRDIYIGSNQGQVSLANIASIEQGLGPEKIERKDQARYVKVSAETYHRDLGSVVKDIQREIDKIPVPPGFSQRFGGAEEERKEAFVALGVCVTFGMILVYMVMASQFESLRDPFIIFLAIPFGGVGVVIALALTGQTISVVVFMGMVMLVGIVVNDGIVLISYINMLYQRDIDLHAAIIEGCMCRLRPVVSTSCTTILAMMPLALFRGVGSEVWVPFATTVIGGLSLATLITLILMPTLYSLFESRA